MGTSFAALVAVMIGYMPLQSYAPAQPWTTLEANSEQRQPVYLGRKPREIALELAPGVRPRLPESYKLWAQRQVVALTRLLVKEDARAAAAQKIEFETWASDDEYRRRGWTFARWRTVNSLGEKSEWFWLDQEQFSFHKDRQHPGLPYIKRTWTQDRAQIFNDFLLFESLYDKPLFGDCVFTDESGQTLLGAWLPVDSRAEHAPELTRARKRGERVVCHVLPQPARINGAPASWILSTGLSGEAESVDWSGPSVQWYDGNAPTIVRRGADEPARVTLWGEDFETRYEDDIRTLDGEQSVVDPITLRTWRMDDPAHPGVRIPYRFVRKNSANEVRISATGRQWRVRDHQLEELVDYLEKRYDSLGLTDRVRQRFTWRREENGVVRQVPQSNLIVKIRGTDADAAVRPILMADHFDTAFSQDHFDRELEKSRARDRISAPGADDNVTAVAALLRAAAVFKAEEHEGRRPKKDIWLVHLTGEEYPADDLGARRFIRDVLIAGKQDIGGLVLMDMIGSQNAGPRDLFQINAGESQVSERMAGVALGAASVVAPHLTAAPRTRYDLHSYLYNTDGVIFSDSGYPVILFNEHINNLENLDRDHYHQTTDVLENIDVAYAAAITKVAIETTARLAGLE